MISHRALLEIIFLFYMLPIRGLLAFSSAFKVPMQHALYSSTSSHLSLSASNIETTTFNDKVNTTKFNVAIDQLETLLLKQEAELRETQLLLEELKKDSKLGVKGPTTKKFEASVMAAEQYGFLSRSEGSSSMLLDNPDTSFAPPANFVSLAFEGFQRNLQGLFGEYEKESKLTYRQMDLQKKLKLLNLNCTAVWEREGEVNGPLILKVPYIFLCYMLDVLFEGKFVFGRFFLLETVARVPYFSYISMLHLYETLGWWRRSNEVKRIHFSEEWNEFHHLLIMESLGGDQEWWVRFIAQHAAIAYYWTLVFLWIISPTLGYKFSEMLETHAVCTYGQFLDENEAILKNLPPPSVAVKYYSLGANDPLFGDYQSPGRLKSDQLNITSLYDVFNQIKQDEGDHVSTMQACLDPDVVVMSPSLERKFFLGFAVLASIGAVLSSSVDLNDMTSLYDEVSTFIEDGVVNPLTDSPEELAAAFSSQTDALLIEGTEELNEVLNNEDVGAIATESVLFSITFDFLKNAFLDLLKLLSIL